MILSSCWVINKKEKSGDLVPLHSQLPQAFKGTKAYSEPGDGNTSRKAVTIDGSDGSTTLDGSITNFVRHWHGHKLRKHSLIDE
jgi:hypothetical protein